jgi:hypothetical protein
VVSGFEPLNTTFTHVWLYRTAKIFTFSLEWSSQVHNAGSGISHAIGTGGHDLSDEIGGLTTFAALEALEADPQTRVIAIVSKPPGTQTLARLIKRFKTCTKPIIGCFLGTHLDTQSCDGIFQYAATIDKAVQLALQVVGKSPSSNEVGWTTQERENIASERASWNSRQKYLRGVLAGGTFCYQSQQILRDAGITVRSNIPLEARNKLEDSDCSQEHTIVDMGADEYTVGRPHPMIDGTLRKQRILAESQDPETAVLLLDFILGYNASMEPVTELLEAISEAKRVIECRDEKLTVVGSVCGTDGDPQILDLQIKLLKEAGVFVFQSNAKATAFCCELLKHA